MKERSKKKLSDKVPFFFSLQLKYAMSYLAILAVVLMLLNTYPVLASQELQFTSKRDALKNQTAVMASALMELEVPAADQVARVMTKLDNRDLDRILVTDSSGLVLYDSLEQVEDGEERPCRYALLQEVVSALRGNDVFWTSFENGRFVSVASAPIIYRGVTTGAICVYEVDAAQGALLVSLQQNLRTISIIIALTALLLSALFSRVMTGRISALLKAIRIVGEGEYGHRLNPAGRDELAHLAEEFNQLTDRLQTTEEVRRRFVADASHELKTPLAAIRLLTDSIEQNPQMDQDTVRDFVGDIGEEAQRLTRITEHLLLLTRLDSQREVEAHPVEVNQVIQRAVSMLTPVADSAGVTLKTDLRPGIVILCTEDEYYQVCFNLIENAIKYNRPEGQVVISTVRDSDQMVMEVADTGLGIPEEDMPKVFNRFYRVDKARSRAAGGTGVGLSIVRDTVRRHGGWVSVRRRHPEGSVFAVGFPLYEAPEKGADEL